MASLPRRHAGCRKPKLRGQVRQAIRTEEAYLHWIKRVIYFPSVGHPAERGEPEINAFLTYQALREGVSASTQNQALSALVFLYRHVFGRGDSLPEADKVARRDDPRRGQGRA
ncbi:MAG: site-specific integrase [Candidatus Oleimicrobiaceae bacterium]